MLKTSEAFYDFENTEHDSENVPIEIFNISDVL